MHIPEKALLEASKVLFREYGESLDGRDFTRIRKILEAAEPILTESAREEAYEQGWNECRAWHQGGESRGRS